MTVALLSAAFVQGLAGSVHCIGMCGPFALVLSGPEGRRPLVIFLYNLGRSFAYTLMGLTLGFIGGKANEFFAGPLAAIIGGGFIILFGLSYLFPRDEIEREALGPAALPARAADPTARYAKIPRSFRFSLRHHHRLSTLRHALCRPGNRRGYGHSVDRRRGHVRFQYRNLAGAFPGGKRRAFFEPRKRPSFSHSNGCFNDCHGPFHHRASCHRRRA